MHEKLCDVELSQIRVSPFQPRRVFAEEEIEELAKSIKQVGLLQPPVVREVSQGDKTLYYELIAGERRWRAAQFAGLKSINVLVITSTDQVACEASLIENIQRVDLTPIETAQAYQKLMEVFRLTQEEIAKRVGKKRSTVANYLRLLLLPQEIQESLNKKEITMGHAKALLSLDQEELQKRLHQLILSKKCTVREAERTSQKWGRKDNGAPPYAEEIREALEEKFRTKVTVEIKEGKGRLIFHFFQENDLESLCHELTKS